MNAGVARQFSLPAGVLLEVDRDILTGKLLVCVYEGPATGEVFTEGKSVLYDKDKLKKQ